jgi:hypothetical protein
MKGLFIPGITEKMFKNASVESVAELMADGKIYDIDYQEPCEDCISRQFMYELGATCIATRDKNNKLIALGTIENLPPVTPQSKTGHWIDIMVGDMPAQACDQCNTFYPLAYTGGGHKYCPNCGIKMESEEK